MSAFAALMAHERETRALAQVMGRLGWDQETMMPPGAADQRATELAALEGVLHARRTDPRIADWLAAAQAPDDAGRAALRLIARDHARACRIPADLAQALARETSLAQGIWARARAADDVAMFLPALARVLDLKRAEAAALLVGQAGGDAYDALLDEHEPGMTGAALAALFAAMRPALVELCAKAAQRPAPPVLAGHFPAEGQMRLARRLAARFGYDFERGRLDLAVHPFSSGSGADVRITTRVDQGDPFNCLYSTLHEVGHACYEQGIDPAHSLTPLGQGVSMGVHESQSRAYENQLGRSAPFARWLHGQLLAEFGDFGVTADEFPAVVNRVAPGFIRTEADELHYNLHVMLRFDLERALISGDLLPADLEAAWNDRFAADFGLTVPRPALGMLQDVHWSVGLFGYFPTYTLGNVYAGCLMQALRADLPDLDAALEQGDPTPATDWLRARVHRPGALHPPAETIARACGFVPDAAPLLAYLAAKYP